MKKLVSAVAISLALLSCHSIAEPLPDGLNHVVRVNLFSSNSTSPVTPPEKPPVVPDKPTDEFGFDEDGIHKDTGTRYDPDGYKDNGFKDELCEYTSYSSTNDTRVIQTPINQKSSFTGWWHNRRVFYQLSSFATVPHDGYWGIARIGKYKSISGDGFKNYEICFQEKRQPGTS